MPIVVFLLVLYLAALSYVLVRNQLVFKERNYMLDIVSDYADADIQAGRSWEWRFEVFEDISYFQMLFSFRPVKSFFRGRPEILP